MPAQVDIPHSARNALDAIRNQRMQRQALATTSAAPEPSPSTDSQPAPLEDTLPPSWAPAGTGSEPPPLEDTLPASADQVNSASSSGLMTGTVHSPLQTHTVLENSEQGLSDSGRDVGVGKMMADEALPMALEQLKDGSREAPLTDTLEEMPGQHASLTEPAPLDKTPATGRVVAKKAGVNHDDNDEMLIRQAQDSDDAGAAASSPARHQDDDDALLQGLLDEEG